ncbi:LuxR C-terminal-related transcriptional regulator [Nesterenkonia sp. LB17]|uniref:helix-turn-helix transcriptional regulator n=1 Tax=Nesterenkonia sp. LB17 TaxID=2901230 RepID=UPI001F4CD82E|nr:LuxR C-terminal-related transcriptional regulator [Nesterenkonia sp. LB17]MCH8564130.1 LuxR C-terminal-related transcriptional regulator [Nesterenkonia sp. LB17]
MERVTFSDDLLHRLFEVLGSPLGSIARGLSELLGPLVSHSALVMFTADISGGRSQYSGDPAVHRGVRGLDLDQIRRTIGSVEGVHQTTLRVGDDERSTLQVLARNGALLVITDPGPVSDVERLLDIWNIVSLHVQERADEAAPDYLRHARSTAGVRLQALSEIRDEYSAILDSILVPLRSGQLSDASARDAAIARSAAGLTRLHTMTGQARTVAEEPVARSFARLKEELWSAARYWHVELEFIEPPEGDHLVPDDIARGARAVVHRVILSRMESSEISRVRVQWDCDGTDLIVNVRDDGDGGTADADTLLQIAQQRVHALRGQISVNSTSGWGAELKVVLPLDPPPVLPSTAAIAALRPREMQVANLLASGSRNRAIADELGISENTVKFHISRILHTLKADSRAEAIAALLAEQRA